MRVETLKGVTAYFLTKGGSTPSCNVVLGISPNNATFQSVINTIRNPHFVTKIPLTYKIASYSSLYKKEGLIKNSLGNRDNNNMFSLNWEFSPPYPSKE